MKRIRINHCIVLLSVFFLVACNQPATTSEKSENDPASVATDGNTVSMPAYDPAMEPLAVGAQFSKKLGDTLGVKMYEFTVKPGDAWALHTHPDHTVYVIEGGKMALYMSVTGKQDTITFPTGMGFISGPLTDSGRNVGNTTIKLLVADIYRPRGK